MTKELEAKNQVVFLAAQGEDGIPIVVLGVSKEAWEYCKDGKSHTFDLTRAGIPIRIMLFGGETKTQMLESLKEQGKAWGLQVQDNTGGENYAIKDKKLH